MIRIVAVFFIVMVMISAGTVYSLKEATQQLQAHKQQLSVDILADISAIKVLRAEMAYLSQPARLQKLSRRFLALSAARPYQMAKSVESVADRDQNKEYQQISSPVDEFPLLLPREKPVVGKKITLNNPLIRKTDFYHRISVKLEKE